MTYLENSEDFSKLVAKGITIVDFYADWCGPCQMLGDILSNIKDYNILKINVDEFRDLAIKNGIMSIPVLQFYRDGKCVKSTVGFKTEEEILDILKDI